MAEQVEQVEHPAHAAHEMPHIPHGAIVHIAEREKWAAAAASGVYAESTLGRTLADEGFIHCSEPWQWESVLHRFYRGYPGELVLLSIAEPALAAMGVPVVREPAVPGGDELFPHLYAALPTDAVSSARPIQAPPA